VTIGGGNFGPGHSGSPVFFTQANQDGRLITGFGGLLAIGDIGLNTACVVRPEFVRNAILNLTQ